MSDDEALHRIAAIVAGYERGALTMHDACSQIMNRISSKNVAEIFANLPVEFVAHLKSVVKSAPMTDRDWTAAKFFQAGIVSHAPDYEPPMKSEAEKQADLQEFNRSYRVRVEAIREYLATQ